MNEWFKRVLDQAKALWAKWNTTQKIILFTIIGAAILAVILLVVFSAAPSMVPIIASPITDENSRLQIANKLDELGITYDLRSDNIFYAPDEKTARKAKMILFEENLVPKVDPWAIFDTQSWTTTDFERNVNLQRAITRQLVQHILALDDVDNVSISLVIPQKELFVEDQNPVTASLILTPKPGSDLKSNRKQLEGIQRLVKLAVAGLKDENIVITDQNGIQLNDFSGMAEMDRVTLAERELKIKHQLQLQYKNDILQALKSIFTPDRVEIPRVDISLDMSKVSSTAEEYSPVTMQPASRFGEPAVTASGLPRSTSTTEEHFQGTGFSPEGPAGTEGQTPPDYKDLGNQYGKYDKTQSITNNEVNKKVTNVEKQPWDIKRIAIAVALDGVWKEQFDNSGRVVLNPDGSIKREYIPVSDDDLNKAKALVQGAIGYDRNRNDVVEVQTIPFDRSRQFEQEDSVYRSQLSLRRTLIFILIGVGAILIIAFIYRLIAKEMERRRRLREEELARQHQAMREAALRTAEEQGVEVELSVEDRARHEMQENAVNMAREHPEDVAQLIRTWLVEE
jgi:flagellar M-ring protein FliF